MRPQRLRAEKRRLKKRSQSRELAFLFGFVPIDTWALILFISINNDIIGSIFSIGSIGSAELTSVRRRRRRYGTRPGDDILFKTTRIYLF
jgi:hypothetical protein